MKDALQSALPERRVVALQAEDVTATDALAAIAPLAAANSAVRFTFFGAEHMKVAPATIEHRMQSFVAALGATYIAGSTPLSGKLQLADKTVFDCTLPEDQAFVAELVYKHAELQRALALTKEQQVIELTITSLHALAVKNGAQSPKYAAATKATLESVAAALQQAGSEDVMLQVTAVPLDASQATTIRHHLQRSLKGDASTTPVGAGVGSQFSTKAMAYGSFMILLYFALAGVYCMCTMKFKRDSLLYSSGKAE